MVFSSTLFLFVFLPVFLLLYYLSGRKLKNYIILFASIFFYAWGAPLFVFYVLASIAIDFFIVKKMAISKHKSKNSLLFLSLFLNLGLLIYFKYANFFLENYNALLELFGSNAIIWAKIALPIGISFFTFQKITYTIDVYRNKHEPLQKLSDYALYIIMFPQLIAGPIIRFHEIANQIVNRQANENLNNRISGFFRFSVGLAKKVLIANVLGEVADQIFALQDFELSTISAWVGVLAYTFQIYYDFSGYSDMAIGLGRMMGFDFPENFNSPYISKSISEFWRRWHITLSTFMRDYLYIPLGGNRVKTKRRLFFNLWFVFLVSGLWHGAGWNFVIWGAFHGAFLIADRLFLLKLLTKTGKFINTLIIFIVVMIGWVFFRAETLDYALLFIKKMFVFNNIETVSIDMKFWIVLLFAAIFAFWAVFPLIVKWQKNLYKKNQNKKTLVFMVLFSVLLLVICSAAIVSSGFNPFIYFRF